ncbi:MAG: Crp/Fnr family transcriptional regulator [Synergistaceae bacterium]|nr:Crp/Fnr family transcriptional regulator [Synergistaceae bacterium]
MENIFAALKKSDLFHGVPEGEIASLVRCLGCSFKSYRKGEAIYLAGDSVSEIGVVAAGSVHVVKCDTSGNNNVIEAISDGGTFAEALVCGGVGILPVSVVAAVDSKVMFFDFERVVTTCPSACVFHTTLIRNMIAALARKNIMLAGKMEHITKRTTREKLLSYLSEQSRLRGGGGFEIPFDRQGLADYLSVERCALSAEMSRLKSEGVISYRKNHFELLSSMPDIAGDREAPG